jgi:hypothetical protein
MQGAGHATFLPKTSHDRQEELTLCSSDPFPAFERRDGHRQAGGNGSPRHEEQNVVAEHLARITAMPGVRLKVECEQRGGGKSACRYCKRSVQPIGDDADQRSERHSDEEPDDPPAVAGAMSNETAKCAAYGGKHEGQCESPS